METELGWKIVRLLHQSEKICSYLADDSDENKKVKGIEKGVAIKKLKIINISQKQINLETK